MEKQRQQIMLPLAQVVWLSKQMHYHHDKSISTAISRILSEYQYLIDKIEESRAIQEGKEAETYKEVRQKQMREAIGKPLTHEEGNKITVKKKVQP